MKNIFAPSATFLITIIAFNYISFAQDRTELLSEKYKDQVQAEEGYLLDKVFEHSISWPLIENEYSYDEQGNLITELKKDRSKKTYKYDQDGYLLEIFNESWSSGNWKNANRRTYQYDSHGNKILDLYEVWMDHMGPGEWMKWSREIFTYYENSLLFSYTLERVMSGFELEKLVKYIYKYNGQGNVIEELTQKYSNYEWYDKTKNTYQYNPNGLIIAEIIEEKLNDWIIDEKKTYDYSHDNLLMSEYIKSYENGVLEDLDSILYSYDINKNLKSVLTKEWLNEKWHDLTLVTNEYDISNNLISELTQYKYKHEPEWKNASKNQFVYQNDKLMKSEHSLWSNESWRGRDQYTYRYDDFGNLESLIYKIWENGSFVDNNTDGPTVTFKDYKNREFSFHLNKRYKLEIAWKEESKSSISDAGTKEIGIVNIFPVPAKDILHLTFNMKNSKSATIDIYDLSGKSILRQEKMIVGQENISLNLITKDIPQGVYYFVLRYGEKIHNGKFIIKR